MANPLLPLARLCALLLCVGCSSDDDSPGKGSGGSAIAGSSSTPEGGEGGTSTSGGSPSGGKPSAGSPSSAGSIASGAAAGEGSGGNPSGGENGGPPPAVDGQSIYALECHGDSKDCNLATVPCFGVGSPTPNVAAGWACANRCETHADCSDAPSGAEAQARCVPFTASGHCMLVCQNENQSFDCPTGMTCYAPEKSPIGYCLWQ